LRTLIGSGSRGFNWEGKTFSGRCLPSNYSILSYIRGLYRGFLYWGFPSLFFLFRERPGKIFRVGGDYKGNFPKRNFFWDYISIPYFLIKFSQNFGCEFFKERKEGEKLVLKGNLISKEFLKKPLGIVYWIKG